ncbi:hypothetical protein [Spirosoma foliorum]|uniref:Uncharacterized protein n=1 Tax=Spirosoma foliorum TaxID=2710596 RepID=A0A7G5GNB2_9BACT|nr:hypothetical protein [Spirosoma foliorum]QMW00354.1 hypothetical protein H3H32_20290 [Spirosoma foliorum]
MIDPQTGAISFSETIQVNSGDSINQVTAFNFGEDQLLRDMGTGWKWLTVKNIVVETNYILATFGFYHDALSQLNLIVSANRFEQDAGWESWSKTDELNTLFRLRQWVLAELGREGTFDWGVIQTSYDPKSGASTIHIQFIT